MSELSPGEKAWAFFLANKNVTHALEADDVKHARRSLNKVLKANKSLRLDLAWPFERLERAEMVMAVREYWWDFGEILDALEDHYGITYEEEEAAEQQPAEAPF
ncbi:hypothetical protein AB0C21_25905 [Spirillospora sp. NPDC049024]